MDKVCLTTYVYGEKYQDYIPFLVYTCNRSYPEYDIILFLYDKIRPEIKQQLDLIGSKKLTLLEEAYNDCPSMSPLKAKSLRWVMYDERFNKYDYIYVVDIDMLYIREPMPLHLQHLQHMSTTGLCYDNIVRHFRRKVNLRSTVRRIKYAGLRGLWQFWFSSKDDFRVSGLHFFAVKQYFSVIDSSVREKYKKMIYNGSFVKLTLSSNNEAFLYSMLRMEGLKPDLLPVQTKSVIMLDFNNPTRPQFRPHHGIHLGIFRDVISSTEKRSGILNSEPYKYYIFKYRSEYSKDPLFQDLLRLSSSEIRGYISNLNTYYKIEE
ncbi:MAG: hypothetical protein IK103_08860 [Bacteroidales bacterium]|nr:hypothetical protein [Bacteroidales bacterium]